MIEFRHIKKSYGAHLVLPDMNLTFEKGEICMLLGPSGCGKSTILKLINHLISPDAGEIWVDGKNINQLSKEALRRNMGYAIQGVGLFPHMQVGDNIAVVPRLLKWPKEKIARRVGELLELVGLPESYGRKYPIQLSGGEAQRVGVARALAANPEILLMDEPFGALDPVNRLHLQEEFLKIQKQLHKTVVFVTHDVGEAVRMADKIVLLNSGRIVAQGDPFSIADEAENVAKAFLGNSYTFELLEKHRICDYINRFKTSEGDAAPTGLGENATLREVMSQMLRLGRSTIDIKVGDRSACVDFDTLVQIFGGGR